MAERPLVSIIVLNWNGETFLEECIVALLKTTYTPLEIIVVDNNSTDASLEKLKKFPTVVTVVNDTNYGYAQGNNIGIARAHGTYIVTLNNDITVDPDWLNVPVDILESDTSVGIICCRQMSYYNREIIDGLYHVITSDLSFIPFGAGKRLASDPLFLKPGNVISVNGGSSIIRKSVFERVGGYDQRFFAYLDEIDLCMKIFLSGWRSRYVPESVVYHKGSVSFKKTGILPYFLRERNRIWFLYKYFPLSIILLHLPFLAVMEVRVIRVMCFKLRRPDQYIKSRLDAFSALSSYRETRQNNLALFTKHRTTFLLLKRRKVLPVPEMVE